mmetsp:Transcript_14823/g.41964  ORF Transcript_14823/g.41964 Transcript_14823/m.41964 type:complete len:204 (+) Transcript_14823:99-710(+)
MLLEAEGQRPAAAERGQQNRGQRGRVGALRARRRYDAAAAAEELQTVRKHLLEARAEGAREGHAGRPSRRGAHRSLHEEASDGESPEEGKRRQHQGARREEETESGFEGEVGLPGARGLHRHDCQGQHHQTRGGGHEGGGRCDGPCRPGKVLRLLLGQPTVEGEDQSLPARLPLLRQRLRPAAFSSGRFRRAESAIPRFAADS